MIKKVLKVAYGVTVTLYVQRKLDQLEDARKRIGFLEGRCAEMWTRLERLDRERGIDLPPPEVN